MSDTLALLQIDHRNMGRLLGTLQRQQEHLARGEPVNRRLIETAFAYLAAYPDRCHHPKEDLVYRKLIARAPALSQSLRDLLAEHATLAARTRDLRRAFVDAGTRPAASGTPLADQLAAFLSAYHDHMVREERDFFPAARDRLTADDWAEIDYVLFDQPDPLFDRAAEQGFAELRNEVNRMGLADEHPAGATAASRIAALRDVEAFNAAMERDGEQLKLVRAPGGGYLLQRGDTVLVDIPDCSEPRAAWCAWFFRQGMARNAGGGVEQPLPS